MKSSLELHEKSTEKLNYNNLNKSQTLQFLHIFAAVAVAVVAPCLAMAQH